jgi:hypothetical protein
MWSHWAIAGHQVPGALLLVVKARPELAEQPAKAVAISYDAGNEIRTTLQPPN